MPDLISYPFRLGPNGSIVTRPDDSSDYYAEMIANLVLTHPGERPQVPLFGLNDPTFSEIDAQELIYKVGIFGPPVRITSVRGKFKSATTQDVMVQFAPLASDAADVLSLRG